MNILCSHIRCARCKTRKAPFCGDCDRLRQIEAKKPRPCAKCPTGRVLKPQGKYCDRCREQIQTAIGKRLARRGCKPVLDLTPELIDKAFERAKKQQQYEQQLARVAARRGWAA